VKRETRVSRGAVALHGTRRVQGEESVLADSGREGAIPAEVGRVRSLAFLGILPGILPLP
jgi:hypothetical protein